MRAPALSLTVALIAVATSGCAGSDRAHVTRARAIAFARAVNLRVGDVQGMEAVGGREPNGQVVSFQLTPRSGCGPADSGGRFDFYSPSFRRPVKERRVRPGGQVALPAEGLHSKVSVVLSAAEQERDFAS